MKSKQILLLASILGALAVILGAFGAHGLADKISPEKLETFKLGVSYQYYHIAALLACGILSKTGSSAINTVISSASCKALKIPESIFKSCSDSSSSKASESS